ncbi:MAG TPA: DUF6279 family lipoprotein [Solimonas sp.]|nr:DUF6279 family lipoprotein [Solimonas sp.]
MSGRGPAMRAPGLVALALCLALASGCSTTSLVYNRLDWMAGWQAGQYADLTKEQEALFDQRFGSLWAWHRATELPAYAQDLRRLAALAGQPIDAAQAATSVDAYFAWWRRSLERLSPDLCALLATLDAGQVRSTLERIDRNNAEDAEEYARPERKLREQSTGRTIKALRRWLGPLSEAQRDSIVRWGEARELTYDLWLDNGRAWRARFAETLAERTGGAQFCARLDQLLLRSNDDLDPPARARITRSREDWKALMVMLSRDLSPQQRRHFREELLELAGEIEALVAQGRK